MEDDDGLAVLSYIIINGGLDMVNGLNVERREIRW